MEHRGPILNALTVDLEDYFHVTAFEGRVARSNWDSLPSRVVANTHRLLELFARHDVKATFFVLGWIADRFPDLIRTIAAADHEIACHSYWHRLVYQMTPTEFHDDLRQARNVIEDAVGSKVVAYRAPSWSITKRSLWRWRSSPKRDLRTIRVSSRFTTIDTAFRTRRGSRIRYRTARNQCSSSLPRSHVFVS